MSPPTRALLAAVLLLTGPVAASAQERSAAEMRAIIEGQLETFRDVRAAPELGATRGLVLVPVEEPAQAGAEVEEAAPEGETQPLDLTKAGTAATDAQHWVLPEDKQLNMRVAFAFDSAAIAETERPKLRRICDVIEETGVNLFRIVGHTDAAGDPVYNQSLSVRRAEEVKRFFVDDCGIAAERLEAIGVGKQFPAVPENPFAGENRRVEFQAIS